MEIKTFEGGITKIEGIIGMIRGRLLSPVIKMIFEEPTAAGSSRKSRKAYTREVMHIVGEAPKRAKTETMLAFDDSELEGVKHQQEQKLKHH